MIIILNRNEPADDKDLTRASLVVRKQGKTFRVLKSRTNSRKVLREEEILNYV